MEHRCENKEIFALQLDGLLPQSHSDVYVLAYAPLADCALILKNDDWDRVKLCIDENVQPYDELMDVVAGLIDEDLYKLKDSAIRSIEDFQNLSILPNNKCNFSCSFCYSAKGRANDELTFDQAKNAIDSFIRETSPQKLSLSILGGGEPLISWTLVKEIIEYAETRAEKYDKTVNTSITTNASLISDEIIEYFKSHRIITVVSYEILEEIQNLHRGHYSLVKRKIERMFELGYIPQFNTVITPENVRRIPEIVAKAHADFPKLKYLCTDPVISQDIFANVDELRSFHNTFIDSFFKAKELGSDLGLKVDCTANLSMECTIDRYCPGEMGVTAGGLITSCPCVSSEKEKGFESYVYGKVTSTGVKVDAGKFKDILGKNLYSNPKCKNCPMKYNCGGGCMHKNNIFPTEFIAETCRFTREFGRRFLFNRLNSYYMETCGQSILQLIENE